MDGRQMKKKVNTNCDMGAKLNQLDKYSTTKRQKIDLFFHGLLTPIAVVDSPRLAQCSVISWNITPSGTKRTNCSTMTKPLSLQCHIPFNKPPPTVPAAVFVTVTYILHPAGDNLQPFRLNSTKKKGKGKKNGYDTTDDVAMESTMKTVTNIGITE